MGRRHGRPDLVMPLQVVAGLRESERGMRNSGVRPVNAMVEVEVALGVGVGMNKKRCWVS
jgi:hypothetical protein